MSTSAKLPLALLAVLALLFLVPGLARASDTAPPTDACAADPVPPGCPAAGTGAAAAPTDAPTDDSTGPADASAGDAADSDPAGAGQQPVTRAQPDPVVRSAGTDIPPACTEVTELPNCIPSCAFLARVLHHEGFCTTLPSCLPPSELPPSFPAVPGVPVCAASGPGTPPSGTSGSTGVRYPSCSDALAHGVMDIRRGQPGYRPALDRDHDGIACESSTSTGAQQTSRPERSEPQTQTLQPPAQAAPLVDRLAYTGAVPAFLPVAGFGLVLGGAALLRLGRRTS